MEEKFCTFEMKGKRVFLDNMEIKGIEKLNLLLDPNSAPLPGKAELELKIIIEFPENMPMQNPLLTE